MDRNRKSYIDVERYEIMEVIEVEKIEVEMEEVVESGKIYVKVKIKSDDKELERNIACRLDRVMLQEYYETKLTHCNDCTVVRVEKHCYDVRVSEVQEYLERVIYDIKDLKKEKMTIYF